MKTKLANMDRKAAVNRLAEITGEKAVYTRAPLFAYAVGCVVFERDATVTAPDFVDLQPLRTLVAEGFLEPFNEPADHFVNPFEAPATEEPAESPLTAADEATGLCISLPLAAVGVGNLTKLLEAKGWLIKKALGVDDLRFRINEEEQTVEFPWWDDIDAFTHDRDRLAAYTTFIAFLCRMSKEAKRINAKEAVAESEKYAFRCFLLRLGFIGPEYKKYRKILLQNLSGSAAFTNKDKADAFSAAQKAKRDAAKEVAE